MKKLPKSIISYFDRDGGLVARFPLSIRADHTWRDKIAQEMDIDYFYYVQGEDSLDKDGEFYELEID
jgi:hypothetical protein